MLVVLFPSHSLFSSNPIRFLRSDDDVMRERLQVQFLSLASRLQSAHFVSKRVVDGGGIHISKVTSPPTRTKP